MREHFWQSPGPQRVLSEVRNALLRGDSVVFRQPEWAPDLIEPLAAGFPAHRSWHEVDDTMADNRGPDALLREALGLPKNKGLVACGQPYAEPVAVIHGAAGGRLRAWARLVRRHHHATREAQGSVRVLLIAPAAARLEREDIGNTPTIEWRDVVGRLDMHLYAAFLWSGRAMNSLERELCVAQTRELSGFCPELAERLAVAGPHAPFEPEAVLDAFCRDRGWGAQTKPSWPSGTEDRRDGIVLMHAALAAARGDQRDMRRRLWQAQIEVLFPLVELVRAELALIYGELLKDVPNEDGGICEPQDVDVGPLAHRLVTSGRVRGSHRDLVGAIRDVRRAMAHLRPVSRSVALNPSLVGVMENGLRI